MSAQASALPAELAAQLENLRDIRLPDPVAWWPLAPGWWIVTALLVCIAVVVLLLVRKSRRSIKALALRELQQLRSHKQTGAANAPTEQFFNLLDAVSALLRRVAIQLPDGQQHAVQHGHEWSEYLSSGPEGISPQVAELLAIGPYANRTFTPTNFEQIGTRAANGPDDQSTPESLQPIPRYSEISESSVLDAAEHWIRRHA